MGARSAKLGALQTPVQVLAANQACKSKSPSVEVDVFRLGRRRAMVDTGSAKCVINSELLAGLTMFKILPTESIWKSVNGGKLHIIGEVGLTIRFMGKIADVMALVMPTSVWPLILGTDWLQAVGATIDYKSDGETVVKVDGGQVCDGEVKTAYNEVEKRRDESIKVGISETSNPTDQTADELTPIFGHIGALSEDVARESKKKEKIFLQPRKCPKIWPNTMGYVIASLTGQPDGPIFVNTNGSASVGREWISPNCIVEMKQGLAAIPVYNLGRLPLLWYRFRGCWETETVDDPRENDGLIGSVIQSDDVINEVEMHNLSEVKIADCNSEEEKLKLRALLYSFRNCFSKSPGLTHLTEHRINTGDALPTRDGPRRVSMAERRIITQQVKEMEEAGIITKSTSPWSSAVVLVRKKNGQLRFCIDYRRLNAVTVKDVYPLPRLDDVVERLSGSLYFTSLDLASGYHQIPVAKEDRKKTAFATPDGLYEFHRLPFGLCGAPPSFQRLMDHVLADLKWKECLVYMDDILVTGSSFDEHLHRLKQVLEALSAANLTLNVEKCVFAAKETTYLGYVVNSEGLKPDPSKVSAVSCFPRPTNVTQLRSFLGLASFYRRFIMNFAVVAQPLHQLLKKNVNFERAWESEQEIAWLTLRRLLSTTPLLSHDDGSSPLEISVDASALGIGAVLCIQVNNEWKPVTFISRSLNPAEQKYHANELEALGLVWCIEKLRPYIYGRNFVVKTDSNVLHWLKKNGTCRANSPGG